MQFRPVLDLVHYLREFLLSHLTVPVDVQLVEHGVKLLLGVRLPVLRHNATQLLESDFAVTVYVEHAEGGRQSLIVKQFVLVHGGGAELAELDLAALVGVN